MQYEIHAYDALYDTVGEQCVGRCDVTITPAGVALTVIDTKEEPYEHVN